MSAPWWIFVMFVWQPIHQAAGIGNVHAARYLPNDGFQEYLHSGLSAQWWISICFLLSVRNVLYSGARGIWIQQGGVSTNNNPHYGGGDGIHICKTSGFVLDHTARAYTRNPWGHH